MSETIDIESATGESLVDGQWLCGDGEAFSSSNPNSGETLWSGHACAQARVDGAVAAAQQAFPIWSQTPVEQRIDLVARFAELVGRYAEQIAEAIHLETGKPLWESRTEAASMAGKFKISLDAYEKRTGVSQGSMADFQTRLAHRPIGVFAVLGPFNFPGHLPNGHIIPALLAGNTLVFKPSEQTPMVGELMVRIWQQAGLPAGLLNMVQGARDTGELLAAHKGLNGLLFTGSAAVGKAIHRQFAGQPEKMLALEMGGNNPLIVSQTQDIDAAVYTILQSAYISAGQRCTCARRLILTRDSQNQKILDRLIEAIKRIEVGSDDDCFMGPVINNQAADRLLAQQQALLERGAKALVSMSRIKPDLPLLGPGLLDVSSVVDLGDEESFGPLLQLKWVDSFEQAIVEANHTEYGLAAGLLSDSQRLWDQFYPRSNAGILNWNRPLTGASGAAPFGGSGSSGNYRPSAYYAADYCAYPVASLIDEKLRLPATLSPGIQL